MPLQGRVAVPQGGFLGRYLLGRRDMEDHEEFLVWARERGVQLHGVEPRVIPGRGIGVVAIKPLMVNFLRRFTCIA